MDREENVPIVADSLQGNKVLGVGVSEMGGGSHKGGLQQVYPAFSYPMLDFTAIYQLTISCSRPQSSRFQSFDIPGVGGGVKGGAQYKNIVCCRGVYRTNIS